MQLRQPNEPFVVCEISKEDLIHARIDPQAVEALTEGEMQDIADKMGDLYIENGYWDDMRHAYACLVAAKTAVEGDHS